MSTGRQDSFSPRPAQPNPRAAPLPTVFTPNKCKASSDPQYQAKPRPPRCYNLVMIFTDVTYLAAAVGLAAAAADAGTSPELKLIPAALLLWGIMKCAQISRRPTTHSGCVASLALVLTGWCIACVLNYATSAGWVEAWGIRAVVYSIVLALFLAGFVVGIVGLVSLSHHRARYRQGGKQASWGIALSVVFTCLFVGALAVGIAQGARERAESDIALEADLAGPTSTDADGDWIDVAETNFRFRLPSRPWVQLDPTKLSADTTLAFRRRVPEVYFQVIAERLGAESGITLAGLAEIVRANLMGAASECSVTDQQVRTVDGIEVAELRADARVNGVWLNYAYRLIWHNGYAYQLIACAARKDKGSIDEQAREMFERFRILDRELVFHADSGVPAQSTRDTRWGFAVDAADSGWMRWDDLAADTPEAVYGVLRGSGGACVVVPVRLIGPEPTKPWFINGMLSYFDVSYPSAAITDVRAITLANAEGYRVTMHRVVDETGIRYRMDLLRNQRSAYLIAAWTVGDRDTPLDEVDRMLERVTILPPVICDRTAPAPGDALRAYWKSVHHEMALEAYTSRRLDQALAYLDHAYGLDPDDVEELINILNVLVELERNDEALAYLQANIGAHGENQDVLAMYAWLKHTGGDLDEAIEAYSRIFGDGFADETYYLDYFALLWKLGREDDAVAELDRFIARKPSGELIRMRATVHVERGEHTDAIVSLRQHLDENVFDAQTAYDLAEAHRAADQPGEGLAVCEQLIVEGYDNWEVFQLRGLCELDLVELPAAKVSFERAATLNPEDEEITRYIKLLTVMLGESGDGSDEGGGSSGESSEAPSPRVSPGAPPAPR